MAGNELNGLMEGFVEGVLSRRETLRLKTLLEKDPERFEELAAMMEMEGLLDRLSEEREISETDEREQLLYMVEGKLAGGNELSRKVLDRVDARFRRKSRLLRIGALAAAGILIFLGGLWVLSGPGPSTNGNGPTAGGENGSPDPSTGPGEDPKKPEQPEEREETPPLKREIPEMAADEPSLDPVAPPVPDDAVVESPRDPVPEQEEWVNLHEFLSSSADDSPEPKKKNRAHKTRAALARLSGLKGEVTLVEGKTRRKAREDDWILSQGGLIAGPESGASLDFPDGTNVLLMAGTEIESMTLKLGKKSSRRKARFTLKRGEVRVAALSEFEIDSEGVKVSSRKSRFRFRTGRVPTLEVDEGEVLFGRKGEEARLVSPGMKAGMAPDGFFSLPGDAVPSLLLGEALSAGDHGMVESVARALMAADPAEGAGVLCEGIRDCCRLYRTRLLGYRVTLEKLKKMHGDLVAGGGDPVRKGNPEFDALYLAWAEASLGMEEAERCALAMAGALRGIDSDEVFRTLLKACREATRLKLGDYLVEALANMTHPGVEEELVGILRNRQAGWRMKVAALDGLGYRKGEDSGKVILDHISSPDGRLGRAARLAHARRAGTTDEPALSPGAGEGPATFYEMPVDCSSVIFVVDCSESMHKVDVKSRDGMEKARFDVLKEELSAVLKDLPDGVNMNVVGFNSLPWNLHPDMFVLQKKNRPFLMNCVDEMDTAWMTGVGEGLQSAFLLANGDLTDVDVAFSGRTGRRAVDTIYFMSDGSPSACKRFGDEWRKKRVDNDLILARVELWNRRHRIRINTISIGANKEDGWLKELGKTGGGEHVFR